MTTVKTPTSHVGLELNFNQSTFNTELSRYNRFAASVTPFAQTIKNYGLTPLNTHSFSRIHSGFFGEIIAEFTAKVEQDSFAGSAIFLPLRTKALNDSVAELKKQLEDFYSKVRNELNTLDCPFVNGLPVVTDEFAQVIRERHVMRVRTEEGSEYYGHYLTAKKAIKAMLAMGARADDHFSLDRDGLTLLAIYE